MAVSKFANLEHLKKLVKRIKRRHQQEEIKPSLKSPELDPGRPYSAVDRQRDLCYLTELISDTSTFDHLRSQYVAIRHEVIIAIAPNLPLVRALARSRLDRLPPEMIEEHCLIVPICVCDQDSSDVWENVQMQMQQT